MSSDARNDAVTAVLSNIRSLRVYAREVDLDFLREAVEKIQSVLIEREDEYKEEQHKKQEDLKNIEKVKKYMMELGLDPALLAPSSEIAPPKNSGKNYRPVVPPKERSTFEIIANSLDERLCRGGMHYLIGGTGTGKSSICDIMKRNNKSEAVYFDIQMDHSNEIYCDLVEKINSINKHIVIDGLRIYRDRGANVLDALLKHVHFKKMGALILTPLFEDLSYEQINISSSTTMIANLSPRETNAVYLHSIDMRKGNMADNYNSLKRFWTNYHR
ncbi:hypothetical protein DCF83_18175 (plasmid) [Edwardsiella tarda]|uniref:H-NS family histone-like protein n=1 Tax=Edwardsiella tarda TaxID=636 RepID=UPI001D04C53F|nr:hypothetical protein [Edwardsiella tarda]UCQ29597.1 hypothetical protein DCF83_18175 [Edwardsiella tarda]